MGRVTPRPAHSVILRRELRWPRAHGQLARWVGRRGEHTSREADALGRQSYLEIALHRQEAAQALELDCEPTQAKDLYGLTTTKAKRFLDELEGD